MCDLIEKHGIEHLYQNVQADVSCIEVDGYPVITTTTTKIRSGNCYVVSPFAMIINYSRDELYKLKHRYLVPIVWCLTGFFSLVLWLVRIDKIHALNNILLSTNFFDRWWDGVNYEELTKKMVAAHPEYALVVRSLNHVQNKSIIGGLDAMGWLPIVTRQVYLMETFDTRKRDIVRDSELLRSTRYVFREPNLDLPEDLEKAKKLYDQLYLEKYTQENIQYTALYLKEMCRNEDLHLRLLCDTQNDAVVGMVGIIGNEEVLTAPMVGYDLSVPAAEALYRRCIMYIIDYAQKEKKVLNLSSGAPSFKINRGAVPVVEYMYVYARHLSVSSRLTWWMLSKISLYFYKPILIKEKL